MLISYIHDIWMTNIPIANCVSLSPSLSRMTAFFAISLEVLLAMLLFNLIILIVFNELYPLKVLFPFHVMV